MYHKKTIRRWENGMGYLFIGPMIIGTLIVNFVPIIATFFLGFAEWNFIAGLSELKIVGLDNFAGLLGDTVFIKSLVNNLIFILSVPITMSLSLFIAIVLNKQVYFKDFFKVVYFMPYISSVVAVAIVWQIMFHPSLGPINQFLMSMGMDNPPKWIADINYALPSVMLIWIWISIGFNLIVYLAGLQSVPKELYEASEIDGANGWTKLFKITIPLLSPTTFFLLITGIIFSFKMFDIVQVLTNGGPANSTSVLVFYMYETAFIRLDIGYASAIALVLFLCIFVITILQWFGQRRWVNY